MQRVDFGIQSISVNFMSEYITLQYFFINPQRLKKEALRVLLSLWTFNFFHETSKYIVASLYH